MQRTSEVFPGLRVGQRIKSEQMDEFEWEVEHE